MKFIADLSVAEEIAKYTKTEGPKDEAVKPIQAPVLAEEHTPIYTMHRYFARRPHNVFSYLIKHYTKPGDIILDPFCGGGVTVVEGLKLRRKVVGVDLNPMATFITKMEVMPVDLDLLEEGFKKVATAAKEDILELYRTVCPKCRSKEAIAEWYEWSNVFICGGCHKPIVLAQAKKKSAGRYLCATPKCNSVIVPSACDKTEDELITAKYHCHCGKTGEKPADEFDKRLYRKIEKSFEETVRKEKLKYPKDKFPDGDRQRDDALYQKGITHFYKLFTKRNLLANARLKKAIEKVGLESNEKDILIFSFSAALSWTSILTSDTGHGWQHHAYWLPNISYELNVWEMFVQRLKGGNNTVYRGKKSSQETIGQYAVFAKNIKELKEKKKSCLLLTQSSHKLTLPEGVVDIVITDPPFGGNVQYSELCDFWAVWLKDELGLKGVIDNADEAIQTRHSGFEATKTAEHYENMLYKVFKECHRVLRPKGWMVMTFHNREVGVWMSLQRAAVRAGFKLPDAGFDKTRGMIYQPPIEHYTPTLHLRAPGSMLGDFILSFQRQEELPEIDNIKDTLTSAEEKDFRNKVEELIEFHGGADESLLMTGLIPYLNEKGLLHRLANFDLRTFLNGHFVYHKDKKWYKKEMVDRATQSLKPMDAIPAELLTEGLITSFLREKKIASLDDILVNIYSTLVNSHRPGIQAINEILDKFCDPVQLKRGEKRKGNRYRLKSELPASTEIKTVEAKIQTTIFGDDEITANIGHNDAIAFLAKYAARLGYDIHVGETEQRKLPNFRDISHQMLSAVDYGINPKAFDIIKEIDLLWMKGKKIIAAFEVATSIDTADKAINVRYRNLFASMPGLEIKTFVIVRDKDYKKAEEKLYTPVNLQDGICDKIKIIKISEMTFENIEKKV
ncbi:hypothetical protein HY768_00345 [candidate division TA06 bacterium]|uniref:DNA methylase N-4/N-6 domain-containing protein n=1 Tax=candidate division TA06 bacterium TaxID=2250710 RepID=A0A933MJ80_UNCT6|nr:hypothetical protein [candidate division TA06 bacterium]